MKKRTTTLAIVLLVMGSVIVYYCLTNDLGGFMTDKTIANTSVIQTRNSAIETKETTVQQPNKETNRKIYQTVEQMPRISRRDTSFNAIYPKPSATPTRFHTESYSGQSNRPVRGGTGRNNYQR